MAQPTNIVVPTKEWRDQPHSIGQVRNWGEKEKFSKLGHLKTVPKAKLPEFETKYHRTVTADEAAPTAIATTTMFDFGDSEYVYVDTLIVAGTMPAFDVMFYFYNEELDAMIEYPAIAIVNAQSNQRYKVAVGGAPFTTRINGIAGAPTNCQIAIAGL